LSENRLFIDTPENVVLEAEVAGFGSRCIAALLDYLFVIVVMIVLYLLFASAIRNNAPDDPTVATGLFVLIQFLIISFYHLIFEFLWNGQTPGKRRIGIRVVQMNGMPMSASAILIRNLVRLFDFLPILYGVGLLVLFSTKHTQRLGDLAARTIVVYERPRLNLNTIQENLKVEYQHISRYDLIPTNIQIVNLNQDDRRNIISYLQRRSQLTNREQVAVMVAQPIAERMGIPGSVSSLNRAEMFLEYVARAFELADS
jgi:uncharacterized RDD family membrane protein YckC